MKISSKEIRQKFIDFFKSNNHIQINSSPLVLENHPSLLFVNSGMTQLTKYFLNEKNSKKDFGSDMLVDTQKCIRTSDLDIIGKSYYHHTFFEMLGSWSIQGAYDKQKAVQLAYDLLTNPDYGFGLDKNRLISTVFGGNKECGKDAESIDAWRSLGVNRISELPASENWWAPGGLTGPGPCGPCTEVLYDRGPDFGPEEKIPGLTSNPRYVEIWNAGVFMQFNRAVNEGSLNPLPQMSVDTGAGLERIVALVNGFENNYQTDLFLPIIEKITNLSDSFSSINEKTQKQLFIEKIRRSADHLKASSFLIIEDVYPSNKDQGYVLRKLLRRVFTDFEWYLKIDPINSVETIDSVIGIYKDIFPEIDQKNKIKEVILEEAGLYKKLYKNTENYIKRKYITKKLDNISNPFDIYQSTGASKELISEIARQNSIPVNFKDFDANFKKHKDLSKSNQSKSFKGGLAGSSDQEKRLHTATHILHWALRSFKGEELHQKGSNINPERLRFDFNLDIKLTPEELLDLEKLVNKKIKENHNVNFVELDKQKALDSGALHFFTQKYGDTVKVYYIGVDLESSFSKEFCGGPHASNTGELGVFKILKHDNVGKGIKRIKATLI